MPDITKCEGTDCPLKEDCYRYTSPNSDYRQSYFMEVPYNHTTEDCQEFWPELDLFESDDD